MRSNLFRRHFNRALKDILRHRFLHGITLISITLSVVLSASFILFASNAREVIDSWRSGVRVMLYLEDNISDQELLYIRNALSEMPLVSDFKFISKVEALESLRMRMQRHSAVFYNLPENPLPDAFELRVKVEEEGWLIVERVAQDVEKIKGVKDVEYGGHWVGRFLHFIAILRIAALGMGGLFFLISTFIVANTIRLAFYSRKEEVEIMRFVGASELFIKLSFYIQGFILGFSGGVLGIFLIFIVYLSLTFRMDAAFTALTFEFSFLSLRIAGQILFASSLVGWIGAYLSFRQGSYE